MVIMEILYGIRINISDFKRLFPYNEYPQLYLIGDEEKADGNIRRKYLPRLIDLAENIGVQADVTDVKGEITHRKIDCDDGDEYETEDKRERGEDSIIIGIILARCKLDYNGVLKVPEVDEETENNMIEFLDRNERLKDIPLDVYSYCDEN